MGSFTTLIFSLDELEYYTATHIHPHKELEVPLLFHATTSGCLNPKLSGMAPSKESHHTDGRTWRNYFPDGDLWVFGYGYVTFDWSSWRRISFVENSYAHRLSPIDIIQTKLIWHAIGV